MMITNKKMNLYLDKVSNPDIPHLEGFNFIKLDEVYFFTGVVNANVKKVVALYKSDPSSDWSGLENTTNKVHLEDFMDGSIQEIAIIGISLVKQLANDFKKQFDNITPIFWLGVDEFSEFPSVTLGFYVERDGMMPLLPKNEVALDKFADALLIVL